MHEERNLGPGDAAPDFALEVLGGDGRTIRLSEQRGHPVLLFFVRVFS
jgi:peroxiredoxin